MPDISTSLEPFIAWLRDHAVPLLLLAVLLFLAYRGTRPFFHRVLVRVMRAQRAAVGDDPATLAEVDRRAETIEDLLAKSLRALLVGAIVAIFLGLFDLWPLVAGLGLVLAALTFAGQSVILDLIMGVLILVEGQYFKGDTVLIAGTQGVVEEVGLRRTVVRDVRGTLHSISNGDIRSSANFTRTFAAATVDVDGVAERDVDAVIAALDAVGRAIAEDAELAPAIIETPRCVGIIGLSSGGATLRLAGRVRPEARVRTESEMRRRVSAALAAQGIELIRPAPFTAR